ncbi:MAG: cytochrome c [Bradyrhizobium sp.]
MNVRNLIERSASAFLIVIPFVMSAPVLAQTDGDPSLGKQTATTICSSCHQIGGGTRRDGPPSFTDIANLPSTTALSLRVFLRSSHNQMPNLIIRESDTDDLIAYILSLKKPFRVIPQ